MIFLEFIQDEPILSLLLHIISDLEKFAIITFIHKGKLFSESKDDLLIIWNIKCTEEEFPNINSSAVKGVRKNKFGMEALVLKDEIEGNYVIDKADIEDIMIFYIKEQMI